MRDNLLQTVGEVVGVGLLVVVVPIVALALIATKLEWLPRAW